MASTFILKRKTFGEYGEMALKALREGKSAGLTGKELSDWVKLNSGSTYNTQSGIKSLGGIQSRPAVGQQMKVTAPNNTFTAATPNTGVTTGGNMVSLTGQTNAKYGKTYKGGADKAFKNVTTQQTQIAKQEAQRAAQRAANKANPGRVAANAMKGKVGVMQGMKNTWGRMGTMGKAGVVTGAAAGGYFLGKGLGLWGNNKEK